MMKQTPAHESANTDLLSLIPPTSHHVVDVGCMHGALARAFREQNPDAKVTGIDIDSDYAKAASAWCTNAIAANVETMDNHAFRELFPSDCWVFGDCLEHLHDPWHVLTRVREHIDPQGSVIVCIPNAQHWSVQWRLLSGNFRYEDSGLLDRTHIRWFTRVTLLEMFATTGWQVEHGLSRFLNEPQQDQHLEAVRKYAVASGLDADLAVQDATPFQYLFRLTPAVTQ